MCIGSTPTPPPPPPSPTPPPRPMQKVKKVESTARKTRKENQRRGGQRSLLINRTAPKTGSAGSGASPY
jgi:hypothetical protein